MVITKDLSRLGRDMTESSYYAERFFPEHGIHYLAPGNDFDSMGDNLMAPFQFAMNDVYLRDTSRKDVYKRQGFRAYRSGSSASLRMMEKSLSRSIVTVFFMCSLPENQFIFRTWLHIFRPLSRTFSV